MTQTLHELAVSINTRPRQYEDDSHHPVSRHGDQFLKGLYPPLTIHEIVAGQPRSGSYS